MRRIAGWASLLWIHRLRQPTLVMAGADDPLVPLTNARILARRIPDARLEVFDCGHLFMLTRIERVARSLARFHGPVPDAACPAAAQARGRETEQRGEYVGAGGPQLEAEGTPS